MISGQYMYILTEERIRGECKIEIKIKSVSLCIKVRVTVTYDWEYWPAIHVSTVNQSPISNCTHSCCRGGDRSI